MSKHISQNEARRLRKRVNELQCVIDAQKRSWRTEWPSSTVICRDETDEKTVAIVETARRLKHAVVVVPEGKATLVYFGCEL